MFTGTCAGACSDTCTGDGRKWDSLAGVGGVRATCLDDNFMCTANDPYYRTFSVLVHEFGHTIHLYGLPGSAPDYYNKVRSSHNITLYFSMIYKKTVAVIQFNKTYRRCMPQRHSSEVAGMPGLVRKSPDPYTCDVTCVYCSTLVTGHI